MQKKSSLHQQGNPIKAAFWQLVTHNRLLYTVIITFIIIIAWIIQNTLFFNWDVSTLILATRLLVNGKCYANDIFTPNPPLILYLYLPPVVLSNFLKLNIVYIFRVYVFALAISSLFLCNKILRKITNIPHDLLIYTLTAIFLILPLYQIGQRDHLLVILSMPYILAVVIHTSKQHLSRSLLITIGIMAGIGFSLKPHFYITFILLEFYSMLRKKSLFSIIRVESLLIVSVAIIYFISLFFFQVNYLRIIVPYVLQFYYQSSNNSWFLLFSNLPIVFSGITIFFYFLQFNDKRFFELRSIIFISLCGFLLSYFLQRKGYFYHIIPAFSFSIFLYSLQVYIFLINDENTDKNTSISRYPKNQINSKLKIIFSLLFLVPVYQEVTLYYVGLQYKEYFLDKVIAYINAQGPQKSIYIFSASTRIGFPLVDYTNSTVAQRFDSLWMTDYLLKQMKKEGDREIINNFVNNKYLFLRMIIDDFKKNKPDLVLIETLDYPPYKVFKYLHYFLLNPFFKKEWRHYNYLTTMHFKNTNDVIIVYKRKIQSN